MREPPAERTHDVNQVPSAEPHGLRPPPWEERERYGILNALVQTIRLVLVAPRQLFSRMPVGMGVRDPLLFAVVLAVLGAMLDWMWARAGSNLPILLPPHWQQVVRGPYASALDFLLSPLYAVILVYARAGICHGVLIVLGGNRLGFEATLRVVAYTRATRLLSMVPFCGYLVGTIWELAVTIIGLARIHGGAPWKSVLAVLAVLAVALATWATPLPGLLGLAALK
jgi:hypothetical protein